MAHRKLRPFFRVLAAVNHVILIVLIAAAILASLTLYGCARAAGNHDPKLDVPALPTPTVPGPAPKKTLPAAADTVPAPTPFQFGEEIRPPKGCLDLRRRGGTC